MGLFSSQGRKTPDIDSLKAGADIEGLTAASCFTGGITEEGRTKAFSIRASALSALGELGGAAAEEVLMELTGPLLIKHRNHIVNSLIAIGTPRALAAAADRLIPFVRAYNHADEERAEAQRMLEGGKEYSYGRDWETLSAYDEEQVSDWRVFARDKLLEIGKPAIPALIRILDNVFFNPYRRAGAAEILGVISDPEALDSLIDASFDANEVVSATARSALARGSYSHRLKQQLRWEGWGRLGRPAALQDLPGGYHLLGSPDR